MHSIQDLIADFKKGKFVILTDSADRENEGDLVLAADFVTPEKINFLIKEARGMICLVLSSQQVDRLKLPLMRSEVHKTGDNAAAFTVSIDARQGISTGISTSDRARTIQVAIAETSDAQDVLCPGHVFPLKAHDQGVLGRAGHTEGSFDLARLAGLTPASLICEMMNDDGTVAGHADLVRFAEKFQIKIGTIEDLIKYRLDLLKK